jgi:hypothetical protein
MLKVEEPLWTNLPPQSEPVHGELLSALENQQDGVSGQISESRGCWYDYLM